MKNILQTVSFACAILTFSIGQTANGQVYGEYQIVDPSNNVYQYDQVQQAPAYSDGVVYSDETVYSNGATYGESVVYDGSFVEPSTENADQFSSSSAIILSKDFGYSGPGTMRDHLWRDHSDDLTAQGTSQDALNAMTDAQVQALHNEFHAAEIAEFLSKNPNAQVQEDPNTVSQQVEPASNEQSQPKSNEVQDATPV